MKSDAGKTDSIWTLTADVPSARPLAKDDHANVCVVGAGIAGMTTAYLLLREGKSVIVVDDGPIAGGESGRTTAHLSNEIDDRYTEIERLHGEKGARIAAESHTAAIAKIEEIVVSEKIDCDFERLDGYLFNPPGIRMDRLVDELDAARRAGVHAEWADVSPLLPFFDTGRCLRFPAQAQFHPVKYIASLARAVEREGGRIYTRSHVEAVEPGHPATVRVRGGWKIQANAMVVATNTPINDRVAIHTKQTPYRTYVIAAVIAKGSVRTALYWDTAEPYHYVRVQSVDRQARRPDRRRRRSPNGTGGRLGPVRFERAGRVGARAICPGRGHRLSAGQAKSSNPSTRSRSSDAIQARTTSTSPPAIPATA